MKIITHNITLDVASPHTRGRMFEVKRKDGGTHTINFTLTENGMAISEYDGVTSYRIRVLHMDKSSTETEYTDFAGTIKHTLSAADLGVFGDALCEVSLYDDSGNRLTSAAFGFFIVPDINTDEGILNDSNYPVLDNLIKTVNENLSDVENMTKKAADLITKAEAVGSDASNLEEVLQTINNNVNVKANEVKNNSDKAETAAKAANSDMSRAETAANSSEAEASKAQSAKNNAVTAQQAAEFAQDKAETAADNAIAAKAAIDEYVNSSDFQVAKKLKLNDFGENGYQIELKDNGEIKAGFGEFDGIHVPIDKIIIGNSASDTLETKLGDMQDEIGSKADKQNSNSGFEGGENAVATTGGAVGKNASTDTGGAIGFGATVTFGGAAGNYANAAHGGAIGNRAAATNGGAIGRGAITTVGFAGGDKARTKNGDQAIDAIQLGTGTNSTEKTMQVYDYPVVAYDTTNKKWFLADVGKLSELSTEDKTSIIKAINELVAGKVNADGNKVLSDNNFTNVDKGAINYLRYGSASNPDGIYPASVMADSVMSTTYSGGRYNVGQVLDMVNATDFSGIRHSGGDSAVTLQADLDKKVDITSDKLLTDTQKKAFNALDYQDPAGTIPQESYGGYNISDYINIIKNGMIQGRDGEGFSFIRDKNLNTLQDVLNGKVNNDTAKTLISKNIAALIEYSKENDNQYLTFDADVVKIPSVANIKYLKVPSAMEIIFTGEDGSDQELANYINDKIIDGTANLVTDTQLDGKVGFTDYATAEKAGIVTVSSGMRLYKFESNNVCKFAYYNRYA